MRCIVEGFSVAFGICSFGSGVPVVPGFRRFKVVRGWVVLDVAWRQAWQFICQKSCLNPKQ